MLKTKINKYFILFFISLLSINFLQSYGNFPKIINLYGIRQYIDY